MSDPIRIIAWLFCFIVAIVVLFLLVHLVAAAA